MVIEACFGFVATAGWILTFIALFSPLADLFSSHDQQSLVQFSGKDGMVTSMSLWDKYTTLLPILPKALGLLIVGMGGGMAFVKIFPEDQTPPTQPPPESKP